MTATAGLLLAAGRSRRFGDGDKLLADLGGRPLVAHAAGALRRAAPGRLIAVVRSAEVAGALEGFEIVRVSGDAQSGSLRAGIARVLEQGAERCLVVLGDMPFVSADHHRAVMARADTEGSAATTDGDRRLPPACFDAGAMAEILTLDGDRGAAPLLRALPQGALVRAPGEMLADVDTPAELAALRARAGRSSLP